LANAFISADASPEDAQIIGRIAGRLLICAAVFQTFDAFGIIFSGALRGAGDTVWPGVITMIYSWVILVGGGWAVVKFAPALESIWPWIAAALYISLFGMTLWRRWASGRWRSIQLIKPDGPQIEIEPAALPALANMPSGMPEMPDPTEISGTATPR
jgi:MATE family multidrug resistance protein